MKNPYCQVAFVQRLLPLYRFGFYKALSEIDSEYHFTVFCPQRADLVNNIKTISFDQFSAFTDPVRLSWVHTAILYYRKWRILWQSNILKPIILKRVNVMMISNNMSHLFYWMLILLCKFRGIKIIFWSHGLQGNEKGFKLWLKKRFLGLADVNLVYAHYNKEIMVRVGMDEHKIVVVYNSLDLKKQSIIFKSHAGLNRTLAKNKYFKNDRFTIIFVSRLERKKKVELLIEAIHGLRQRNVICNLLIVGTGSELLKLKALVDTYALEDSVIFKGEIYDEEKLADLFFISDLLVSPGNVGLNCIHSLYYGVPVLTHDDFENQNPEVESIIPGENGLFFKKDDLSDLVDKIELWKNVFFASVTTENVRATILKNYTPEMQVKGVLRGLDMLFTN